MVSFTPPNIPSAIPLIVENTLSKILTIPCHAISQFPVKTPVRNVITPSSTPRKPVIIAAATLIAATTVPTNTLAATIKAPTNAPPKKLATIFNTEINGSKAPCPFIAIVKILSKATSAGLIAIFNFGITFIKLSHAGFILFHALIKAVSIRFHKLIKYGPTISQFL